MNRSPHKTSLALGALAIVLGGSIVVSNAPISSSAESAEAPTEGKLQLATLGGGCFWCTEAFYQQLRGVYSVMSGYSGGRRENPTY